MYLAAPTIQGLHFKAQMQMYYKTLSISFYFSITAKPVSCSVFCKKVQQLIQSKSQTKPPDHNTIYLMFPSFKNACLDSMSSAFNLELAATIQQIGWSKINIQNQILCWPVSA